MGAKRTVGQAGRPSGPPAENVMGSGGYTQPDFQVLHSGGLPGGPGSGGLLEGPVGPGGGGFNSPWGNIPMPGPQAAAVMPDQSQGLPALTPMPNSQPQATPPPPPMFQESMQAPPPPVTQSMPAPPPPPPPAQQPMASPQQAQTRPGGPPAGIRDNGMAPTTCPTCGK